MLYHHRDDEQRTEIRLDEDGRLTLDREGYAAISHRLSRDDALDLSEQLDRLISIIDTENGDKTP